MVCPSDVAKRNLVMAKYDRYEERLLKNTTLLFQSILVRLFYSQPQNVPHGEKYHSTLPIYSGTADQESPK